MRKGHGDALCRSEAILAVENHTVTAIEKNDGGARAVIFALMHHEVRIGHVDGNFRALAADGVEESFADVQIHGVAELVGAGDAPGLDARGEVAGVVTSKAAA